MIQYSVYTHSEVIFKQCTKLGGFTEEITILVFDQSCYMLLLLADIL